MIIALLLEKCRDKVKITKDVVKAIVGNVESGEVIIALLLKKRKHKVKIT